MSESEKKSFVPSKEQGVKEIEKKEEMVEIGGLLANFNNKNNQYDNASHTTLSNWDTTASMNSTLNRYAKEKDEAGQELIDGLPDVWKKVWKTFLKSEVSHLQDERKQESRIKSLMISYIEGGEDKYEQYLGLLSRWGSRGKAEHLHYGSHKLPKEIRKEEVDKGFEYFKQFDEAVAKCKREQGPGWGKVPVEFLEARKELIEIAEKAAPYWWVLLLPPIDK